MSIRIYNTLTRKKEEFQTLQPDKVKMYACGPTVYNHIHIGNARPAIFFDVVRRYLEYRGYEVQFIQNFTDVDDKIIRVAEEMGKSAKEISEMFISSYHHHTERLGVCKANYHPKVTENMVEIIHFIAQLVEQDLAYEVEGDVYFRTKKFKQYGKLSHQRTDELQEGFRIEVDERKESSLDFALWKKSKQNEIYWESPWGKGRPGWHIECSAMIKKYLGDTIDIHGGGLDLTFPHHENEIAQSESLHDQPLATYWMHSAMLLINDQKMSKSLGNFVLINDVLEQYDPQVVRFFLLSGHYRSPLNYSDETLQQAKNGFERLKNTISTIQHKLTFHPDGEASTAVIEQAEEWQKRFVQAMDDDFNTANAISVLFEMVREINTNINQDMIPKGSLEQYHQALVSLGQVLGLQLEEKHHLLDEEVEAMIEERNMARQNKDYARADELRDLLLEKGIVIEDTAQGIRWKRK